MKILKNDLIIPAGVFLDNEKGIEKRGVGIILKPLPKAFDNYLRLLPRKFFIEKGKSDG